MLHNNYTQGLYRNLLILLHIEILTLSYLTSGSFKKLFTDKELSDKHVIEPTDDKNDID